MNDTEDKQYQVQGSGKAKEGPNNIVIETTNVTSANTNRQTILERKAHVSVLQEHCLPLEGIRADIDRVLNACDARR